MFDQYEIFHYPGACTVPLDGQSYAATRLETLQREQEIVALQGNVRGVMPGCRFQLREHPQDDQNRGRLILRARHAARNNEYEAADKTGRAPPMKSTSPPFPPTGNTAPPMAPRPPPARDPDTAVVVGPSGSEIFTDQYGRVKVHFHWDRYGKKDGNDSCWIRVSFLILPWHWSIGVGTH